jgi:glycosyltransferase involved in cell wall biosynthesis
VLFDAWRDVAGDCSSSLVFVGATASAYFEVDPALAAGIRETAARDGLAGRMMFVEQTRTIEEFYRAADVFVFPSRREAFGMALVEAMATGLPCIASHLPGVTDEIVRDGDTGLLVAPHDVAALTAALRRVLQDGALAARLGAAARRDVVARFSIDRTARLTLDAYLRLLEAHPPAAATA